MCKAIYTLSLLSVLSFYLHAQEPVLLKDIAVGPDHLLQGNTQPPFIQYKDAFFFYSVNPSGKAEFMRSDGTTEGTYALVELPDDPEQKRPLFLSYTYTNKAKKAIAGDHLYFVWYDEVHGVELWKTDGTQEGTRLFKDLQEGAAHAFPANLLSLGDKLVFTTTSTKPAGQVEYSPEQSIVWGASDADESVEQLLVHQHQWSEAIETASTGQHVYFMINDYTNNGIWKTDGTATGTKWLHPSHDASAFTPFNATTYSWIVAAYGNVYFPYSANPSTSYVELNSLNGSTEQATSLDRFSTEHSYPRNFVKAGGKLYFIADKSSNTHLFVTDGSEEGTRIIPDENLQTYRSSWGLSIIEFKDQLCYFENHQSHEGYLKSTDGTTIQKHWQRSFKAARLLLATENELFFSADDGEHGQELWRTDGSDDGTYRLTDINPGQNHSTSYTLFQYKDQLFFKANDGIHGYELWKLANPTLLRSHVFLDSNQNGTKEVDEPGLFHQKLLILPNNIEIFTNSNGNVTVPLSPGSYTVQAVPDENWEVSAPAESIDLVVPESSQLSFGFKPRTSIAKLNVILTAITTSRCNTQVTYWLDCKNTGTLPADGEIQLHIDPLASLLESYPPAQDRGNGLISWNFTNLAPTQQERIRLKLLMPDFNSMGDTLRFYSQASVTGTNVNAKDTLEQVLLCSYDPNDKAVKPAGIEEAHFTLKHSWLDYTIRFQNTGNDTAFHVVLRDTLDINLNTSSYEILSSSHNMQASRKDRALAFRFNDIKLPDSTRNEPDSHGFVRYRIKADAAVAEHTVVENKAYIFFDYNPAIVTNTTFNTLVNKLPERVVSGMPKLERELKIYPNPSKGSFQIESITPISEIEVYNAMGQLIHHQILKAASNEAALLLEPLPAGIYLLNVKAGTKEIRQRIVKH